MANMGVFSDVDMAFPSFAYLSSRVLSNFPKFQPGGSWEKPTVTESPVLTLTNSSLVRTKMIVFKLPPGPGRLRLNVWLPMCSSITASRTGNSFVLLRLLTTFISPPPAGAAHTGETTKRRLLNHHVLARLQDSLALFVMLKPLSTRVASTKQANNVKGDCEQCS